MPYRGTTIGRATTSRATTNAVIGFWWCFIKLCGGSSFTQGSPKDLQKALRFNPRIGFLTGSAEEVLFVYVEAKNLLYCRVFQEGWLKGFPGRMGLQILPFSTVQVDEAQR
ncbi:hypothetical protein NE237_012171 [Protea cynaroides]|uniref:Uncharacterized protein n=1 Tax=Protea cynaroides TaxID=273540 RepID=A0A9Q0GZB2_9MAGN|nr:hypothetical protein NE237_012171 [Protea cynaroides]